MIVFGASWGDSWGDSWGRVDAPVVIPGRCILSPLAIAMQGVGFGQHLFAVQGLWCILDYLTPEERDLSGGGGPLTKPKSKKHDKAARRFIEQLREEDEILIALIGAAWEQGLV